MTSFKLDVTAQYRKISLAYRTRQPPFCNQFSSKVTLPTTKNCTFYQPNIVYRMRIVGIYLLYARSLFISTYIVQVFVRASRVKTLPPHCVGNLIDDCRLCLDTSVKTIVILFTVFKVWSKCFWFVTLNFSEKNWSMTFFYGCFHGQWRC